LRVYVEVVVITPLQKDRIAVLRARGESYAAVAAALGISENTVKSFCYRNGLGVKQAAVLNDYSVCINCDRPLTHTPGAKRRRFCSDTCRMSWWNAHREAVNRKAVYSFVCPVCGAAFESYGNAKRKYCSRACYGMSRRAGRG
jgi:endogenous inhibitor of DNA gyrase (YacG/DUF329 family)